MEHKVKNLIPMSITLIFLLLASRATAQQATGADGSAIVRRSLAAMGCSSMTEETTATLRGSLTTPDGTVMPLTMYSQGSNHLRSELNTPKGQKVTIVNNGRGQMQHSDGRTEALADHNTSHQRPTHIPCLSNLSLSPGKLNAVVIRTDQVPGDLLDVVEIASSDRPKNKQISDRMKTTFWISRNTGFLAKMQYVNAAENDGNATQAVDVEYSDYRPIDGVDIPFHQVTRSGDIVLDLRFDSVQLNSSAADFNLR